MAQQTYSRGPDVSLLDMTHEQLIDDAKRWRDLAVTLANEKRKRVDITAERKARDLTAEDISWVLDKVRNAVNAPDSPTYRKFVYDYLGFGPESYVPLISGLALTNALCELQELRKFVQAYVADPSSVTVEMAKEALEL
jgi:hypothetical protein